MFRIRFRNSNESSIFVQVDPWAGLYELGKGDEIEISAIATGDDVCFDVEELNDTRILTLWNSEEYFVVRNGHDVHWTEFPTNIHHR